MSGELLRKLAMDDKPSPSDPTLRKPDLALYLIVGNLSFFAVGWVVDADVSRSQGKILFMSRVF